MDAVSWVLDVSAVTMARVGTPVGVTPTVTAEIGAARGSRGGTQEDVGLELTARVTVTKGRVMAWEGLGQSASTGSIIFLIIMNAIISFTTLEAPLLGLALGSATLTKGLRLITTHGLVRRALVPTVGQRLINVGIYDDACLTTLNDELPSKRKDVPVLIHGPQDDSPEGPIGLEALVVLPTQVKGPVKGQRPALLIGHESSAGEGPAP